MKQYLHIFDVSNNIFLKKKNQKHTQKVTLNCEQNEWKNTEEYGD